MKKRYAVAGTGVRGICFARGIIEQYADTAELSALYDTNLKRAEGFCQILKKDIAKYDTFEGMVREAKPQTLIITTPDSTHADLIEQAFKYDMDVVVEKPLATTVEQLKRIARAEKEFGREITVTFNYRYSTFAQRLKELLLAEDIGDIKSVNLEWFLDKVHGTEYFRRWHADMKQSGGLFVHKATHHFDLVNWLTEDEPEAVSALGSLQVMGSKGPFRGKNCRQCEYADKCDFALTMNDEERDIYTRLYFKAESEDGYIRDNCVFRDNIDIYDTMNAVVKYKNGAQLSYALTAFAPYEGFRLTITGTRGRFEAEEYHGGLMMTQSDESHNFIRLVRGQTREDISIRDFDIPPIEGMHGGGDDRLYMHLFTEGASDPLKQKAGLKDGAASCLIGICANQSVETGQLVEIPVV